MTHRPPVKQSTGAYRAPPAAHVITRLVATGALCMSVMLAPLAAVALGAGITWHVTSPTDSATDGDLSTHTGSLRFILSHAQSGDFVSFDRFDTVADKIFAGSPLIVPDGVSVGRHRHEACGSPTTPVAVVEAEWSVNPVFSLGAGSTLRNLDIGGGDVGVKIAGADVDVCGVGLGIEYDEDGVPTSLPPWHAALIVDGPRATVAQNYINGAIVVSTLGSDSRIGDAVSGSGDANRGFCGNQGKCPVTLLADTLRAAQRITIRDPFPRALHGITGNGVFGGDDVPTHANNWAQTPTILIACAYDDLPAVHVAGIANPRSLVDIYFDDKITISRQDPAVADVTGRFTFSGPLPGSAVEILTVSTLNDPAYPGRVGSSSQMSLPVAVSQGVPSPSIRIAPATLTFTAVMSGTVPAAQLITVSVPPDNPQLQWQTSVITAMGGRWLSATPTGSGNGVISVAVNPDGLSPGTYHGSVSVAEMGQPCNYAMAGIALTVQPPQPTLSALGSMVDLSGPPAGPAKRGDVLRFTVTMTNTGAVHVTNINSTGLSVSPALAVLAGSGAVHGDGLGFVAIDSGFSAGTLGPGSVASYTLDLVVTPAAESGTAVVALEVNADGVVSIPVVSRMSIAAEPVATRVIWLPLVIRQ
jgi:hypothetical protein